MRILPHIIVTSMVVVLAGRAAAYAPDNARARTQVPVAELPAPSSGDTMAVIYSGDGGWRDIDKQIGDQRKK